MTEREWWESAPWARVPPRAAAWMVEKEVTLRIRRYLRTYPAAPEAAELRFVVEQLEAAKAALDSLAADAEGGREDDSGVGAGAVVRGPAAVLTARDVAPQLGMGVRRVQQLCDEGKLRHTKIGRQYVMTQADVDAYRFGSSGAA